jgi:hypothetical protein
VYTTSRQRQSEISRRLISERSAELQQVPQFCLKSANHFGHVPEESSNIAELLSEPKASQSDVEKHEM